MDKDRHPALDEAIEAVRQAVKDMWVNEDVRAEKELNKAEVAAHKAVADVDETSRELKEKIEETKAHTEEKSELEPQPPPDPFDAKLPPATPLVVTGYNDEG